MRVIDTDLGVRVKTSQSYSYHGVRSVIAVAERVANTERIYYGGARGVASILAVSLEAVSYTHLTLPTIYSV